MLFVSLAPGAPSFHRSIVKGWDSTNPTSRTVSGTSAYPTLAHEKSARMGHPAVGIGLFTAGAAAGPWIAGADAWMVYGITTAGGGAVLTSGACDD
jgi:hypothetical protein